MEDSAKVALLAELWEQLGSPAEFLGVPYGQATYHALRGEFDRAQRLAEDLLYLSRHRNDSAGLLLGHLSSGRTLMFAGRFAPSRSHLEEARADPISQRSLVHQVGFHPYVNSQTYLGIVLFCLGFPDQALAQSSAAITEARRLAHPPSLAGSLTLGAVLLSFDGDNAVLGEWVDRGGDRAGIPPLGCAGNHLSRLVRGQEWQCGGGNVAPTQRFGGLPRHRGEGVDALSYRPPGQGMRDRRTN
jgi:hypothetical protein